MPWHKHTPQASNTFSRNSMTTRWLRLDSEAYKRDHIQTEKEEAANTQTPIVPMIEEAAQEQKEEEETRQGTPRPQNPNRGTGYNSHNADSRSTARRIGGVTPRQVSQWGATSSTNATTLASTDPTTEVMTNLQTGSSQPPKNILTILEEEWGHHSNVFCSRLIDISFQYLFWTFCFGVRRARTYPTSIRGVVHVTRRTSCETNPKRRVGR